MKIQNLAVLFIIIILPISLVLATYTKSRVETISLQATYDSKLNDATHDALKAYQVNSFSDNTSIYVEQKIVDIEASVNTFFNSMATNFSSLGYTKDTLQNYIPALVYTMYDGYYIYAPFTNTYYDDKTEESIKDEINKQIKKEEQKTYKDGQNLYGLKPYVYYSCRYKEGENDVVVTYSLDNYIQIQGIVKGNPINEGGYVLNKANSSGGNGVYVEGDDVYYNGIKIEEEKNLIRENVYVDEEVQKDVQYIKKNGTKYYLDNDTVFTVLNGKKISGQKEVSKKEIEYNSNAKEYYKQSWKLMEYINTNLGDVIKIDNIQNDKDDYNKIKGNIFDDDVEAEDSNFNTHRIDVIKHAIEKNLSVAIFNFNHYSGVSTDFKMPKLKDSDWDKIMDNISIISFFQGANIGGKVYNGYSIVTNTKNEDVVMEDSIYIKDSEGDIHRITENGLSGDNSVGIFNINLEERSNGEGYYLPVTGKLSYDSVVTQNNISNKYNGKIGEYVKEYCGEQLKKIYYTALARERYGLYRPTLESD